MDKVKRLLICVIICNLVTLHFLHFMYKTRFQFLLFVTIDKKLYWLFLSKLSNIIWRTSQIILSKFISQNSCRRKDKFLFYVMGIITKVCKFVASTKILGLEIQTFYENLGVDKTKKSENSWWKLKS